MDKQTPRKSHTKAFSTKRAILALLLVCALVSPLGSVFAAAKTTADLPDTHVVTDDYMNNKHVIQSAGGSSLDPVNPIIIKEDISKRGEYEKHFLCDDGSFIAITYPEPVHKKQGDEWEDAKLPLSFDGNRIKTDLYGAEASFARNTAFPAADSLVFFNTGKYELRWLVKDNNANGNQQNVVEGVTASIDAAHNPNAPRKERVDKRMIDTLIAQKNAALKHIFESNARSLSPDAMQRITVLNDAIDDANRNVIQNVSFERAEIEYPGVMGGGTTLKYVLKPGSVKENLELAHRGDFVSYTSQMNTDGLKAELQADNSILLKDEDGEIAATISSPYMYDYAGADSSAFTVTVTQNGNDLEITYTPDSAWLDATERIWPVVIDPEIATNSKDIQTSKQIDNYVYDGQGDTIVSNTSKNLYVGYKSGKEYRTYWRLADLPGNAKGYTITGSSFNIRFLDVTSTMGSGGIELYTVTDDWESSKIKWTQRPGVSDDRLDVKKTLPASTTDGRWMVFNEVEVKKLVEKWYNGTANNYGFMLKYAKNETDHNAFYSADNGSGYFPYLEVKYQNSPPPKISNYNVPRFATKGTDVTLSATVTGKNISHGYWVIRKPNKDYLAHAIVYNQNKTSPTFTCTYTFKADDFGDYTVDFGTRDDNGVSWAEERTMTVKPAASYVSIKPITVNISIGGSQKLTAEVAPSTALQDVDWSMPANDIVELNTSTGLVKGLRPGTVTITAKAKSGTGVPGTRIVTVLEPFNYTSSVYNKKLALDCAEYSMLAYDEMAKNDKGEYVDNDTRRAKPTVLYAKLHSDSFINVAHRNYGDDIPHNVSYVFAMKQVLFGGESRTLVAIVIRGTDKNEWEGNMDITGINYDSSMKDHYSFKMAEEDLRTNPDKGLDTYLKTHAISNPVYLITGHSRGAAVANLLAETLTAAVGTYHVFSYTFATPNNTMIANLTRPNIRNFCFDDDFVPQVPLMGWGYNKHGKTTSKTAEALYNNNQSDNCKAFKSDMDKFVKASREKNEATFSLSKTTSLLDYVEGRWSDVQSYYAQSYGTINSGNHTLYTFFRKIVAPAAMKVKTLPLIGEAGIIFYSPFSPISNFFIEGSGASSLFADYIYDAHHAFTYYTAIKYDLFT